jgi:hypothetical protein
MKVITPTGGFHEDWSDVAIESTTCFGASLVTIVSNYGMSVLAIFI